MSTFVIEDDSDSLKPPSYELIGEYEGESMQSGFLDDNATSAVEVDVVSSNEKTVAAAAVTVQSPKDKPLEITTQCEQTDLIAFTTTTITTSANQNQITNDLVSTTATADKPISSTPKSREFLALQRSLNESKILSNMVSETSGSNVRKSRKSVFGDAIPKKKHRIINDTTPRNFSRRKLSNQRQSPTGSNCSSVTQLKQLRSKSCTSPIDDELLHELSQDSFSSKRSNMRSQNAEFKQKQMDFWHRVKSASKEDGGDSGAAVQAADAYTPSLNGDDVESLADNVSNDRSIQPYLHSRQKMRLSADSSNNLESNDSGMVAYLNYAIHQTDKPRWDAFCFKCHLNGGPTLHCSQCVRSYHSKCTKLTANAKFDDSTWICPECLHIENALTDKRNRRSNISLEFLNELIGIALGNIRKEHEKWRKSERSFFDLKENELPSYYQHLVHTPTLHAIEEKIHKKLFRCTEEFFNEVKWIVHNAEVINNGVSLRHHVSDAHYILKMCRQECNEIDLCPDCYQKAQTNTDWFVDVCSQPHLLLWAKLKGFPYWPAKAMDSPQANFVNVRFFGAHDRSSVPVKDCYLYSEREPNVQTSKKMASDLKNCMAEVNVHIDNLRKKIGKFEYAPYKTPYDPTVELHQLEEMMPGVVEFMRKQQMAIKEPLQFKIVKTDGTIAMVKSSETAESGTESDQATGSKADKHVLAATNVAAAVTAESATTTADKEKEIGNKNKSLLPVPFSANYEVVPSVSANITNSTKVIIKRKSITHELNVSPTKMAKTTKNTDDAANGNNAASIVVGLGSNKKPKQVVDINEQRSKHDKHEQQRLPKVTIKTNANKSTPSATIVSGKDRIEEGAALEQLLTHESPSKVIVQRKRNDVSHSKQQRKKQQQQPLTDPLALETETEPTINKQISFTKPRRPNSSNAVTPATKHITTLKRHDLGIRSLMPIMLKEEATEPKAAMCSTSAVAEQTEPVVANEPIIEQPPAVHENDLQAISMDIQSERIIKTEPLSDVEDEMDAMPLKTGPTIIETPAQVSSNNLVTSLSKHLTQNAQTVTENIKEGTTKSNAVKSVTTPLSCTQKISKNTRTGVPYGPLPAPATIIETPKPQLKNLSTNVTQRARKTFPSRCNEVLASETYVANQLIGSRNLINMVSIPLDVNNRSSYLMPINVPPLMAVSKNLVLQTNTNTNNNNNDSVSGSVGVGVGSKVGGNASGSGSIVMTATIPANTMPTAAFTVSSAPSQVADMTTITTTTTHAADTTQVTGFNMYTGPPPLAGLTLSTATNLNTSSVANNDNTGIILDTSALPSLINSNSNNNALTITPSISTTAAAVGTDATITYVNANSFEPFATPLFANASMDNLFSDLPRMTVRPLNQQGNSGNSSLSPLFFSQAGPHCQKLSDNAHKLADFFITAMCDTMSGLSTEETADGLMAKIAMLKMELERTKQKYEQQLSEQNIKFMESRKNMENDHMRSINELRKHCELERKRAVDEAKRDQWCSRCQKQAKFYCCWNTTYCTLDCQRLHWNMHQNTCQALRANSRVSQTPATFAEEIPAQSAQAQQTNNNVIISQNGSGFMPTDNRGIPKTLSNISPKITIRKATQTNTNTPKRDKTAVTTTELLKLPSTTLVRPIILPTAANNNNVISNNNGNNGTAINRMITSSSNNNNNNSNNNVPTSAMNARILPTLTTTTTSRFNRLPNNLNANVPYTLIQGNNGWEIRSPATITSMTAQTTTNSLIAVNSMQRTAPQQRNQRGPNITSIQINTNAANLRPNNA